MLHVSSSMNTLGIDIGASKIAFALVKNKRIVRFSRHPLTEKTTAEVSGIIARNLPQFIGSAKIDGVGVGVPCVVDASGKTRRCVNIPKLRPEVVVQNLRRRFRTPVILRNDVQAAALGELALRKGIPRNFIFLAFGSGIGGAIIAEKKSWRGENGWAGEVGHFTFQNGMWERYASGQFLKRSRRNEELRSLAQNIGTGLANIVFAYAPKTIIIGGGLSAVWRSKLEKPALAVLKKRLQPYGISLPRVTVALLGEKTGAYGAALLATHTTGRK